MSDPIRLRICPACQTGIPEDARRCPECGVALPPLDAGIGGEPLTGRIAFAPIVRTFLGRHVGCLGTTLTLVFGVPVLIGALAGNALAGLGVVLIAIGVAGLALTGWLIWLVWPARRE